MPGEIEMLEASLQRPLETDRAYRRRLGANARQRRRSATPGGRAYQVAAKQRYRATVEGQEAERAASRRSHARPQGQEISRDYKNRLYHEDPAFRMKSILRTRQYAALKGLCKSVRTMELTGCTIEQLRIHLESQFLQGMSWDNYGEWEVDHRRPCESFDLREETQQWECFHYSNLQPMWAPDNASKGAKWA